jgi:hypothetical protein
MNKFKITETNKNVIASIIIAIGMITSVYIFESSHRYNFLRDEYTDKYMIRVDNWTGKRVVINTLDGSKIIGYTLNFGRLEPIK